MNLIERVKNILITPKTEWNVIAAETATPASLLTGYVLPLSVIAAIGTVLKFFVFSGGYISTTWAIGSAVASFVVYLVSYYVTVYLVDAFAPSFNSEKNLGKSAQLVAYSSTPSFIAGLLSFIPGVGWLISIAAWVYGIYLMYLGIGTIKKTPEDKKVVYMLVVYVIMIAIYMILGAIFAAILLATLGMGVASALRY